MRLIASGSSSILFTVPRWGRKSPIRLPRNEKRRKRPSEGTKRPPSQERFHKPCASVHLDVVALVLLHLLRIILPHEALLLRDLAEALLHARLHTLKAAHVDVRLRFLYQLPELFAVLRHLRLDVHLLPCGIFCSRETA